MSDFLFDNFEESRDASYDADVDPAWGYEPDHEVCQYADLLLGPVCGAPVPVDGACWHGTLTCDVHHLDECEDCRLALGDDVAAGVHA